MAEEADDPGEVTLLATRRFKDGREEFEEFSLTAWANFVRDVATAVAANVSAQIASRLAADVAADVAGKVAQNESDYVTVREVGRDAQGRISEVFDITTRRVG